MATRRSRFPVQRATTRPQAGALDPIQRIRMLERRLTGHKTVPALNPPAFVQLPWNSWTFERLETTNTDLQGVSITVGDVLTQIRSRLLLQDGADIRIKVHSAQIWCTAAGLIYPDLESAFYELSGETSAVTQQPRSTQRDKGTLNMPARCGYQYPSSDKREILDVNSSGLIIMNGIATSSGSDLTFRCQVLWQSSA